MHHLDIGLIMVLFIMNDHKLENFFLSLNTNGNYSTEAQMRIRGSSLFSQLWQTQPWCRPRPSILKLHLNSWSSCSSKGSTMMSLPSQMNRWLFKPNRVKTCTVQDQRKPLWADKNSNLNLFMHSACCHCKAWSSWQTHLLGDGCTV